MQGGHIHKQVDPIMKNITVVTDFRKDVEISSNSFGFVLSLAEFNLIKSLQDILAAVSSQTYQYFLLPMVAFN